MVTFRKKKEREEEKFSHVFFMSILIIDKNSKFILIFREILSE